MQVTAKIIKIQFCQESVFLRLTTRICCQIAVSCQIKSPETLENTAF